MGTQKNIAILAGGGSSEHGISMKSARIVEQNIQNHYATFFIEVKGSDWNYIQGNKSIPINKNDFTIPLENKTIHFDLAFIAIHGTPGEDGKLQGYFDMLNIPYSSSSLLGCSISFNKGVCNDYLKNHGINVAQSIQLFEGLSYSSTEITTQLGLPCFVKPNQSGSSYGVHKIYHEQELESAIADAFSYDKQVLVESYLQGREVTCGITNFNGVLEALPITEIITNNDFFDFEAKYKGESIEITPAEIDTETRTKVEDATKRVYQVLNLNGVARVDFILQDGIPYMIEANTVPGLSAESLIPQQAVAAGYSLEEFFVKWVEHCLKT